MAMALHCALAHVHMHAHLCACLGKSPLMVVGTAGSVDTGAIDDLQALADIAREEGLWLHVDGAYGALGILSPKIAPLLRGIELADSIAFDFHKWAQVRLESRLQ